MMNWSITACVLLASLVSAEPLERRAACAADNCARAVTGTATLPGGIPLSSRRADCSSFLATTTTPVTTVTVTVASITTTVTPMTSTQSTPAYASACSGTVRYSSACNCFSPAITRTTATASTSTVTVTVTSTPVPFRPCTGPPYGNEAGPGAGGCPSSCYCDHDVSGGGFCENATGCGPSCSTDADCDAGTKCTDSYTALCGGPTCLDSSSCVGATKRSLLASLNYRQMVDVHSKKDKLPLHPDNVKRDGMPLHPGSS